MTTNSKRVRKNNEKSDSTVAQPLDGAITALLQSEPARFDESVEIAVNLGIDPKKSDQAVRGAVSLPHGTGKSRRVVAFVKDPDKQEAAIAAGAIEAGADDLVKKVTEGWTDFDVAVAAPDMMGMVGRLGKVLGPQGKMPTPKAGTVTPDVAAAVRDFTAGKIEFRADAAGTVHALVGKRSFDPSKLADNVRAFLDAVTALRPTASKGHYVKQVYLSTTMGPSVQVEHTN